MRTAPFLADISIVRMIVRLMIRMVGYYGEALMKKCHFEECEAKTANPSGYCDECEDHIEFGEEILDGTFRLLIKPAEFK